MSLEEGVVLVAEAKQSRDQVLALVLGYMEAAEARAEILGHRTASRWETAMHGGLDKRKAPDVVKDEMRQNIKDNMKDGRPWIGYG